MAIFINLFYIKKWMNIRKGFTINKIYNKNIDKHTHTHKYKKKKKANRELALFLEREQMKKYKERLFIIIYFC